MHHEFLLYKSSRIHYIRFGAGRRLLLCFHGYGESAASFVFLEEALQATYTVIAIDMPFHGETVWNEGLYLAPSALLSIIESIVSPLHYLEEGWTILGYSMGGRVALLLLQLAPEKIIQLVLLSTDGLQMNPWYWLATQTKAGNRLFQWTMKRPGWLLFLLQTGHVLRVVNPSIFKFTAHYIDDDQVRENLYIRWTAMRGFRPNLKKTGDLIHSHRLPVQLLYGSYDRIIRWERGERFRRSNTPFCQLTLLPAGHQLLQPKFLEVIVKALYLPII